MLFENTSIFFCKNKSNPHSDYKLSGNAWDDTDSWKIVSAQN